MLIAIRRLLPRPALAALLLLSASDGGARALVSAVSTDGGRSWVAPVSLQRDQSLAFNDKNTLSADPTDAPDVYAVWDRLDAAGNGPTLLARSTDGGDSWQPSRVMGRPGAGGRAPGRGHHRPRQRPAGA